MSGELKCRHDLNECKRERAMPSTACPLTLTALYVGEIVVEHQSRRESLSDNTSRGRVQHQHSRMQTRCSPCVLVRHGRPVGDCTTIFQNCVDLRSDLKDLIVSDWISPVTYAATPTLKAQATRWELPSIAVPQTLQSSQSSTAPIHLVGLTCGIICLPHMVVVLILI